MSAQNTEWLRPSSDLRLTEDEVHVWRVSTKHAASEANGLLATLQPEERSRAERFRFERDRKKFIYIHGTLRIALGRYLQVEPDQLRYLYTCYGKPYLADQGKSSAELHFNISCSKDYALFAFARRQIGIDIEHMRPGVAADDVAERFFSKHEVDELRRLPRTLQDEAFLNCWTRKEAYIKARGEGLSIALDLFEVSLIPGQPAALLSSKSQPDDVERWSLRSLVPGPDYISAVAVERTGWKLKCWEWTSP